MRFEVSISFFLLVFLFLQTREKGDRGLMNMEFAYEVKF